MAQPPEFVLQRVVLHRPMALRPLYWRSEPDSVVVSSNTSDGMLSLPPGARISFGTYGNALFERQWRLHTGAGAFTLHVRMRGRAALRVWRGTEAGQTLLHEAVTEGDVGVTLPHDTPHWRQAGRLWFDLRALRPTTLHAAHWSTPAPGHTPARLGVVICTVNRPELPGVLNALAAGDGLDGDVARVVVVNQGRPGLTHDPALAGAAARLGPRLRVLDQANLGGAGGFGRGLLEVLDDPAATHCCFLDDDVKLEPEALRRMAAFFTLANSEFALGGHMLDSVRPTTLYEAGAVLGRDWALTPLRHNLDLAAPATLDLLLEPQPMHYNGWWMCGFPKSLATRLGMPLPCFIRGDDVEWGLRLHDAGVPTVSLPGVGIWHEPFYLKLGGWQLYYETRNALACAALHQPFSANGVAWTMLKRLLLHALTHRYYSAALIVRGIEDFCRGPAVLDGDPRPIHASLAALRERHPETPTPPGRVLPAARIPRDPQTRAGFVARMARALLRHALRSAADAQPRRVPVADFLWFRVLGTDVLAVDTHWDRALPTFRRDRAQFHAVMASGLRALWRLRANVPGLRRAWQEAAPRLTSVTYWREYVRTE